MKSINFLQFALLMGAAKSYAQALPTAQQPSEVVSVGGFEMTQSDLNIALLIALGFLAAVALLYFIRFRMAKALTNRATELLSNLEEEHEGHVRSALKREQKLRRQLQDELNRHKIANAS